MRYMMDDRLYQYTILITMCGLLVFFAVTNGELNDAIAGALFGMMAGTKMEQTLNRRKQSKEDNNNEQNETM